MSAVERASTSLAVKNWLRIIPKDCYFTQAGLEVLFILFGNKVIVGDSALLPDKDGAQCKTLV
ncbi:MAG: hypothetical protein CMI09_05500 [Oceanospirillaceae bacterium]|nr:hypothetical protein [Oceanospirillaceae bacterium]